LGLLASTVIFWHTSKGSLDTLQNFFVGYPWAVLSLIATWLLLLFDFTIQKILAIARVNSSLLKS